MNQAFAQPDQQTQLNLAERERERTDALHDGEIPPGPDAAITQPLQGAATMISAN